MPLHIEISFSLSRVSGCERKSQQNYNYDKSCHITSLNYSVTQSLTQVKLSTVKGEDKNEVNHDYTQPYYGLGQA